MVGEITSGLTLGFQCSEGRSHLPMYIAMVTSVDLEHIMFEVTDQNILKLRLLTSQFTEKFLYHPEAQCADP